MIARSFKSVIWVATVGGAALSCYMVSLRVATERADLAKVERQILVAKRDIRMLQTELGTRGRMTQLEDWNANVLALSAPTSAQFVHGEVALARLERTGPTVEERTGAEVRMASAETGAAAPSAPAGGTAEPPKPQIIAAVAHRPAPPAQPVVHQASYTTAPHSPLAPEAKPDRAGKNAAKAERHAKAAPAKATAASAPEKKLAAKAKPASDKKLAAGARPTPEKKLAATAKPVPARKAEEKKLAARGKPVRHPGAGQESDAD